MEPRRPVVIIRVMLSGAASAMLAFCMGVAAAATAYAGHYIDVDNPVPEIDGSAGVAALALLASVGIIAYNRIRK
jgi:hypothetical protein